jgi:DNA-binding CsgD family transcriptional regulator
VIKVAIDGADDASRALLSSLLSKSPEVQVVSAGDPGADLLIAPASRARAEQREEPLTHREIEVLEAIAAGRANKQIADELGISSHTVKFHTSSIYQKLHVTNRAEAVALGIRRGLLHL